MHESAKSSKGLYILDEECNGKFYLYEEIYNNSLRRLKTLYDKGINPGDQLLIDSDDLLEFLYTFWGCILGGIIAVPIKITGNTEGALRVKKLFDLLDNPFIFLDKDKMNNLQESLDLYNDRALVRGEFEDKLELANPPEISLDSVAIIQFSSGSTGDPKGVVLTHRNLVSTINDMSNLSDVIKEDKFLSWLPLSHNMGLIGLHMMPFLKQCNQVLIPTMTYMKKPEIWLQAVNKFRITTTSSPNFGFRIFVQNYDKMDTDQWDLSCLKRIYNGAEPISMDLCRSFYEKLKRNKLKYSAVYTVYGLAEATLAVAFPKPYTDPESVVIDRRYLGIGDDIVVLDDKDDKNALEFAVVGYNLEHCDVSICDEDNNKLSEGKIGLVNVKGINISSNYYKNPNKIPREDGWYNTGDLGFLVNGKLVISGRHKEIIIINGQNFYPFDIERICCEVEGVVEGTIVACGCYNKQIEKEELLIFVKSNLLDEEFNKLADSIIKTIWERLSVAVDKIIKIDEIPKTVSSKIARFKLVERYIAGEYDKNFFQTKKIENSENNLKELSKTEKIILEVFKSNLDKESISVNDNLSALGLNSLSIVKIANELNEKVSNVVSLGDMYKFETIKTLGEYIDKKQKKSLKVKGLMVNSELLSSYEKVNSREIEIDIEKDNLIAIIAYILSRINNTEDFSIEVMNKREEIRNIEFDLSEVDDLFSIVDLYRQESNKAEVVYMNEVNLVTEDDSKLILIYKYDKDENINIDLKTFLLTFGIEDNGNKIMLHIKGNSEISKEVLDLLVQSINNVVNQINELI